MIKAKMILACAAVLGLVLSGQRATADEPAGDSYVVIIKKVEVHKTNKENEAWDLNNGAPDLQVIVRNVDVKEDNEVKSKEKTDGYAATYNEPTKLKVTQGQTLEFEVVDKDFDLDDTIGKMRKKIEKEGTLKLENFGRVIFLEIELKKLN